MKGYIYMLTLLEDVGKKFKKGEVYIGKTNGKRSDYYTSGRIPKNIIKKYGKEIFDRQIIHQNINCEDELNKLEVYYIGKYNSFRPENNWGLNLTLGGEGTSGCFGDLNSNFGNKWTEEQKKKASIKLKKQFESGQRIVCRECAIKSAALLKEKLKDNDFKRQFSKNVSNAKAKFNFLQYDREMNLVVTYSSMIELLELNPDYKQMPIFSTCNGWKASYKGFIWRYQDKETGEIIIPENKRKKKRDSPILTET